MSNHKISFHHLMTALEDLGQTIENDPNNFLEAARNLSAEADIPVGWIARIEMGAEVMDRDGEITSEEAIAVIDIASKMSFIDQGKVMEAEYDPFFIDNTPFLELMEMEAALIANDEILKTDESILAENERRLAANEEIIRSGSEQPLHELKELTPLQPVPHM